MEHRWGERFAVDFAVRIAARPYTVRAGRLVDLSISGARIQTACELRNLVRVQIAIALPNQFEHPIPMVAAYVVRRHGDGVCVEWCDLAPKPVVELLKRVKAQHPRRRVPVLSPPLEASAGSEVAALDMPLQFGIK
jgi:hypothetical protein